MASKKDRGGDVGAVVENMRLSRAAQQGDQDVKAQLAADAPPAPAQQTVPAPDATNTTYVLPAGEALIAARPAELADPVPIPVGLTERGWSPEVTARHPELVAQTMAELDAESGAAPSGPAEPVDPLDAVALADAQRELGFADVRKNNLRVGAINRNSDRLWEGITAASNGTAAARAANAQAVEEAQVQAETGTSTAPPTSTGTAPTPAPKPTPAPAPPPPPPASKS